VRAPERKERCEGCGASLGEPSIVDHHVVEDIMNPHPRLVIYFLEFEWMCTECGSHTVSRHPGCPAGGRLEKNVLVQATLMKFHERLPHWKVSEALERTYGFQVTPATVLDLTRRVGDWLRHEYMRILQRICSAEVVYVDETGARGDGVRHWTWPSTAGSKTFVVIRRSRGKKVLKEVLGEGFGGVVVCDGWRSYPNFTGRLQRCWAHLLREARCLAEHVEEAGSLSEKVHGLYRRLNVPPMERLPPGEALRLVEEARALTET